MANNRLTTRIILRNDTTAGWQAVQESADYKLLRGEIGIEFLTNGKVKMKIGDGQHTWKELSYFGGGEGHVFEKTIAKGEVHIGTPAVGETPATGIYTVIGDTVLDKGDVAIIKEEVVAQSVIDAALAETPSRVVAQTYQYTAYVFDGTNWKAMDGNYSAENVYFDEDLTYTANIGVLSLGSKKSDKLQSAGKSLEAVMKSILAKTEYSSKTDPSFSLDSASATYSDLEVGNYITALNWTTTFTDGKYSQGTVTSTSGGGYTTTQSAGCSPKYLITNSVTTTAESSVADSTTNDRFNLGDSKVQIDSTSSKTYATVYAKCGYSAPTKYPATNLGDYDSSCTQITAKGLDASGNIDKTSAISKSKDISLTGYRKMFYKCFSGTPETLTSSYVRENFTGRRQVGNQIADSSNNLKDTLSISIPEGTKEVVICLWNSKKITSATDEDNKQTVEFKNNFVADNSTVAIEGANSFTSVNYTVYRYVAASPLKANTYYIKIG